MKTILTLALLILTACGASGYSTEYLIIDAQNNAVEVSSLEACQRIAEVNETGEDVHLKIVNLFEGEETDSKHYRLYPDAEMANGTVNAQSLVLDLGDCTVSVLNARTLEVEFK